MDKNKPQDQELRRSHARGRGATPIEQTAEDGKCPEEGGKEFAVQEVKFNPLERGSGHTLSIRSRGRSRRSEIQPLKTPGRLAGVSRLAHGPPIPYEVPGRQAAGGRVREGRRRLAAKDVDHTDFPLQNLGPIETRSRELSSGRRARPPIFSRLARWSWAANP